MAGPASPGSEGPTFAPPQLPAGWIAQWDGNSKKYYFVQLSTGVSQWDTPTDAAPVGGTPGQNLEHPYGVPGGGGPQVITHPDGTQTIQHPDGRKEPILPPSDGARGGPGDGPSGERGFGSFAANTLMNQLGGGHGGSHGGGHGGGSNPIGSIISGLTHSGGSNHGGGGGGHGGSHGGSGGGLGGVGGKLASQLASNLFSSGNKPQQPQNYHGGATNTPQHSGGLAGSVMGGVAHMFGGGQGSSSNQNYGYSNTGSSGGYTGSAPPTSYQPASQGTPSSYHSPPPNQNQSHNQSYPPPNQQQHGTPSYQQPQGHQQSYQPPSAQPPHQQYGHSPAPHQPNYGTPSHQQPQQYGGQPQYYPPPPQQAQHSPYPGQPSYNQGPQVPHGSHPGYGSNPPY